uniref:DEAD/DEAH box helicase family protein n=1 Tax=Pedobacter sp. TaxID=1411316 RepID=UPI003D7FCC1B
ILTDSVELDKQLEGMFSDSKEPIKRAVNGRKLLQLLRQPNARLFCSLVQKSGKKSEDNIEDFIKELETNPISNEVELYVLIDDCHKTQNGKLYLTMKTMLQKAVFLGFTGTPLLKKDKKVTMEIFGDYIHTFLREGSEEELFSMLNNQQKKSTISA